LNIKVLYDNDNGVSFKDYLRKLGVVNPDEYLKLNTIEDDLNYDNIELAVETLYQYKTREITILADTDGDGYTSASMLYSFLTELGYKCNYILHDKNPKSHGLDDSQVLNILKSKEPSLLIVPDAGTSDENPCKKLRELGWEIIILDHHKPLNENNYAIIVNNQMSEMVVNKSASGCLVTWHFMHLIDADVSNKFISYVAISIISDSMSFLTNENITFIYHGLKNMHPNIKRLIDSVQGDYKPVSFSFGGFNPKCNSTIRLGTIEDKKSLFELMCGLNDNVDEVSKIIKHYHSQQNVDANNLIENNITILNENSNVLLCKLDCKTPLTGLVANKLMGKTGKSVLIVHDREDGNSEGSARSPINLREILNNSGLFNYNSGHDHSFGTSYKTEDEAKLLEYFDNYDFPSPCYTVFSDTWNVKDIDQFGDLSMLWGNDLIDPLYYQKLVINTQNIDVIGESQTTIRFKNNDNVTFIKFYCTHEWIDNLKSHDKVVIEVIGRGKWNEWRGNKYPQFIIDRMEYREPTFEDLFLN